MFFLFIRGLAHNPSGDPEGHCFFSGGSGSRTHLCVMAHTRSHVVKHYTRFNKIEVQNHTKIVC